MARPRAKINDKRCMRLKQLIGERKITQTQLSEETGISQQAISAMVQGKANVTETTSAAIVRLFPEYSTEWLLGFSDYKNNKEKFRSVIARGQDESNLLLSGLIAFARLTEYKIDLTYPAKNMYTVEERLKIAREGYTISHNNASIRLSIDEMNAFENEVCDFVELQLKHLFKRKGVTDNG